MPRPVTPPASSQPAAFDAARSWWRAAVAVCWAHLLGSFGLLLLVGAATAALMARSGPGSTPVAVLPLVVLVVAVAAVPFVARILLARRRRAGAVVLLAYGAVLFLGAGALAIRNAVVPLDGARDLVVGVPAIASVLGAASVVVAVMLLVRSVRTDAT